MKNKTTVQVHLNENELARLDMFRQHLKSRSGKLPMRSVAIAILINDIDCRLEQTRLKMYADVVAAVDDHTERITAIEQQLEGK